uniref:ATP dependent Clp protease ATP binding subunit clpA-like protein subunit A n=1 Tax=Eustigmatophyceae sp. Mont 10/10-1w TaxID=2506145 RepID=A0A410D232_9STRA|nr:ATP dependent Clp protease ATP binding subunit clpA-like protein subunit A [Eustigmatophyceae sp. Mont 10/10-1w]QAA11778.1 ATP dependent Clp protease ATP binding subunit clpA-like protein subunit A [Eustigmatophyceae sp. Mont 10/10-1w]
MENRIYFELDEDELYELSRFTKDLTMSAELGLLDPLVGRDRELERMIRILCRRTKNNPVIIGEPGVGKTALVEGLAQKIVNEEVPKQLINASVVTVDLGGLVAGTRYRGEFEERLQLLIEHAQDVPDTILFIDEIHTLIGAGSAEGTMDAANLLKPVLSRGKFRCIGATTTNEYKKYIERDPALERRFQPILVEPPSRLATIKILCRLRRTFELFHSVVISNEALVEAVELSDRYIPDRYLPDKAIDVIDEACTLVAMRAIKYPPGIVPFYERLNDLEEKKNEMIRMNDFYGAARINEDEARLRIALDNYQNFYSSLNNQEKSLLKDNKDFLNRFIPAMESTQRLEEILDELQWLNKSEGEKEVSVPFDSNESQAFDADFNNKDVD